MPRDVSIRIDYDADSAYMTRMMRAIEKDKARPLAWRKEIVEKLREMAVLLLQAPPRAKEKAS